MALFLLIFGAAIFALFLLGGYVLASIIVSPDAIFRMRFSRISSLTERWR